MQRTDLIYVIFILNNGITGQIQPFILEESHHHQQQNFQVKLQSQAQDKIQLIKMWMAVIQCLLTVLENIHNEIRKKLAHHPTFLSFFLSEVDPLQQPLKICHTGHRNCIIANTQLCYTNSIHLFISHIIAHLC